MIHKLLINDLADLEQFFTDSGVSRLITPSPKLADSFRDRFSANRVQTETISHFLKNLGHQIGQEFDERFKSKSELFMLLAAASKSGAQDKFHTFSRAFNLFTEIRSFSLEEEILFSITDFYDAEVRDQARLFHKLFVHLDFVDEHARYNELKNELGNIHLNEKVMFLGFDYMGAIQIDFINELGKDTDIYIPLYKNENLEDKNYWGNWIEGQTLDIGVDKELPSISIKPIPGNTLSLVGEELLGTSVVLGEKTLTPELLEELPVENMGSKASIDLFEGSIKQLKKSLDKIKYSVLTVKLEEILTSWMEESLKKEDFIYLKTCSLFRDICSRWESLSDKCEDITFRDALILLETLKLDLPRLNYFSFSHQELSEVVSIQEIEFMTEKRASLIFLEDYILSSKGSYYSESVEKYLISLGPLKKGEHEVNNLKNKLHGFLNTNQVTIFLQNGLEDKNKDLLLLFEGLYFEKSLVAMDFGRSNQVELYRGATSSLKELSATKLQTYLDCPRKYYLRYIEGLSSNIVLDCEVSPIERGLLLHKVIERHFKESLSLKEIMEEELKARLQGKALSSLQLNMLRNEIQSYASNGVEFLKKLEGQFLFETTFTVNKNGIDFNGDIDCFSSMDGFVIDFKRSNASFSSYTKIESFEKIQLWFYLSRLVEKNLVDLNKIAMGYIDLSEIKNSMFFVNDSTLETKLEIAGAVKIKSNDLAIQLKSYEEFEERIIDKIKSDREFKAYPQSNKMCSYCPFDSICNKGAV